MLSDNPEFGEMLRNARIKEAKDQVLSEQEFADCRRYYYGVSMERRTRMKENLAALIEIDKRLRRDNEMAVEKVQFSFHLCDNEGTAIISVSGEQSPKLWLEAMELWDETEDLSTLLPLA